MTSQLGNHFRRLIVIGGLLGVMLAGFWTVNAQAPTDFTGTWALDKAKSQGLPPRWENLRFWTKTVTRNDSAIYYYDQLTVANSLSIAPRNPASLYDRAEARRQRNKADSSSLPQNATYRLDGTETQGVASEGYPSPVVLSAQWKGTALELTSKLIFSSPGRETTMTITELWELSQNDKVLTIHQSITTELRPGQSSILVFNKQ